MLQEGQVTQSTALALPDEGQFKADIQAINRFQQVVRANMVDGQDYGIIPGTQKPTLLKPGAEKIAKLLGLADHYLIEDKTEDWQAGFFRYLIKCRLVSVSSGVVISEGLGECNSMESKYRWRWVGERDLPRGIDKTNLVSQVRTSRAGGRWTVYRFDNEDIFSQVNTILKMAMKRALVSAALSAGRLSQIFTQDIEDMAVIREEPTPHISKAGSKTPVKSSPKPDLDQAEKGIEELFPEESEQTTALTEPVPNPPEGEPTIETIQALLNWVASHGKQFTPSFVCETLGAKSVKELADIPKAYQDLKSRMMW